MKRIAGVIFLALVPVVLSAGAALGQAYPPEPKDTITLNPPQESAFTGANLSVPFIVLAGLVVVGALALFLARRRAAAAE